MQVDYVLSPFQHIFPRNIPKHLSGTAPLFIRSDYVSRSASQSSLSLALVCCSSVRPSVSVGRLLLLLFEHFYVHNLIRLPLLLLPLFTTSCARLPTAIIRASSADSLFWAMIWLACAIVKSFPHAAAATATTLYVWAIDFRFMLWVANFRCPFFGGPPHCCCCCCKISNVCKLRKFQLRWLCGKMLILDCLS